MRGARLTAGHHNWPNHPNWSDPDGGFRSVEPALLVLSPLAQPTP